MSLDNKKVLFINGVAGIKSTGRIVCQLAKGVLDAGGDAYVCYGREQYNGNIKSSKFINNIEVNVNALFSRFFDNEGLGLKNPTKKLIKIIKDFKPDIIHLHNIHGYYLNYKILFQYIKQTDIKVVWTLHDCWTMTGHCAHFDSIGCDKWKTGCFDCPNKKEYPKSLLLDRSKSNYEIKKSLFTSLDRNQLTIVTPSKWLLGIVRESYLNKYNSLVINNGVDLSNFNRCENTTFKDVLPNDKEILLGVAVPFTEKKGYSDFIKLNEILDKEKYQIVLVGVNKKQQDELKSNGIIGISKTNNQKELAELYSTAKCFLNLTYEDTFPTVNIESIACGCPIITYKTGGSPELINDNNGIVVECGDVASVNNALEKIDLLKIKRDIETNCDYNMSSMINKYIELYSKII